jgi:hypothetical protein
MTASRALAAAVLVGGTLLSNELAAERPRAGPIHGAEPLNAATMRPIIGCPPAPHSNATHQTHFASICKTPKLT